MDIKLAPVNGFKLNSLTNREYFVKDRPNNSFYNALLVCKKKNQLLKANILHIIFNVKRRYYGNSPLDPTGPVLMGKLAKKLNIQPNLVHSPNGGFILQNNNPILTTDFPEYNSLRNRMNKRKKIARYDELWAQRKVYISLPKYANLKQKWEGSKASPLKI